MVATRSYEIKRRSGNDWNAGRARLLFGQNELAEESPHFLVGVDQIRAAAEDVHQPILNSARPDVARTGELPQHDFGSVVARTPFVFGRRDPLISGSRLTA